MAVPETKPVLTREERRAKREARRAKQREENVGRGENESGSARVGGKSETTSRKAVPLTAIQHWLFRLVLLAWRGSFYPAALPTNQWFEHYAKHFKTVELNVPFYSWPTTAAVHAWVRQTERRKFVFTVKASELITHVKRFSRTKTLVRDFGHIADLLGPRMGCFLFQLPPSFHYSRARLDRILTQLEPSRRNVVEFRHRSWWRESVFAAFRAASVIFCSCSGPRLPDELVKSADDVYIRFHGAKRWYRHDYTREELAEWIAKIRAARPARVWAYFNNDCDGYAIRNARMLLSLLRA